MATVNTRLCKVCSKPLAGRTARAEYCSHLCYRAQRRKYQSTRFALDYDKFLPIRFNLGAIGELSVCVDLMRRGYTVYRAVSSCAKCDLVALKDGRLVRVEVKTGRRLVKSGKLHSGPHDPAHYDIKAVVDHLGAIEYSIEP